MNLERLLRGLVDGGCRGSAPADREMRQGPWFVEVVMRSSEVKGFELSSYRDGGLDRTFGLMPWCRQFNQDCELKAFTSPLYAAC